MADPTRMTRMAALALLGLSDQASTREVTRAYRRLAKTTHPDLAGQPDHRDDLPQSGSREAGHRFASLTDAYRTLTATPTTAQPPPDRHPTPVPVRVRAQPPPTRPPIVAGPVRIAPSPPPSRPTLRRSP